MMNNGILAKIFLLSLTSLIILVQLVVFNYTGSFRENQETIVGKSYKALNTLSSNINKYDIQVSVQLQLFDAFVGSILHYSSEVWGYGTFNDIEKVHLNFCKRILNVKGSTSTLGVYGELGRYPLSINRYGRIIKYWCKLLRSNNSIIKAVYNLMFNECTSTNKRNWLSNVKTLLDNYDFLTFFMIRILSI